jgi:FADH2 O2-dependent halogenase
MNTPDFDVAIVGGGPAGSSMGAYLARAGINCVIIEKALFPRPHVGESLVPASTRVLKDIGFLPQMEEHRFPRKYGAAWTSAMSKIHRTDFHGLEPDTKVDVRFDERDQPGVNQNYTYHVDRGKFDLLLLQHAHTQGAQVCEGVTMHSVNFDDPAAVRLQCSLGRKKYFEISARMVVDASGRQTMLGNQLRLKENDPVFNQYALHTWFEGYDRGTGPLADFIFIHFLPIVNTWIWQIPITETITSIGVVTQRKNFVKASASREEFFWQCLESRPELHERLQHAQRLRGFTAEGDYSYTLKHIIGDRFVLIGDAARFVDPIFSTGVSLALNAARLASRDIIHAMETGDCRRASFENYNGLMRRGIQNWYEFIKVYYRLNILFTVFIKSPRHRLDVLKLLQGDVYDDDRPAVLEEMRAIVSQVEQNPKHVWHHSLGDLTANAFVPE